MLKISIHGIGNFGFALLKHLSKNADAKGNIVIYAHDRNKELIEQLQKERRHPLHHKNVTISDNVVFINDIQEFMDGADVLILAVTSNAISEVVNNLKPFINKDLIILNTAKALDVKTGQRFSTIISNSLEGVGYQFSLAMFAGGTIAKDLFNHEPLGVDIASESEKTLEILKRIFIADNLNVYTTTDLAGVEYASSFKNVLAIFAGIVYGLGFSYGSETHMISRAANEVKKLVISRSWGLDETFSLESQCWGNDMWMSCTGNTRNREFGILLGQGNTTAEALEKMSGKNKTVEGVHTVKAIAGIIKNCEYDYPILYSVHKIIFENESPRATIINLMNSNNI